MNTTSCRCNDPDCDWLHALPSERIRMSVNDWNEARREHLDAIGDEYEREDRDEAERMWARRGW